ncbi:TPA: hypothetical protein DF272_02925 [Candidatus Falkowbacteria bacterium]|nr:hypothetical protein [Candidatus Falkowbacteria bacterium]
MRKIIFDIETQNTFAELAKRDVLGLNLSLVGVYDSATDSYTAYLESELTKLWPILEHADVLIGFNSNSFDIPILNKYYQGDLTKIRSLDILEEIHKVLGRRTSLNSLAEGTLQAQKSGDGLMAVEWWKKGEIEKLKKYCLDDVRVTKDIYEFALNHGYLLYKKMGEVRKVPLDTRSWEGGASHRLNLTLPF